MFYVTMNASCEGSSLVLIGVSWITGDDFEIDKKAVFDDGIGGGLYVICSMGAG